MEVGVGNSPETGGVAMEFPVFDGAELSSPPTVPPRLRRRLTETKSSGSPSSVEEIEAKLRNADLRRQKFYESLSSKARPKRRSPQYANGHNLGQRLEAKLQAAEQKRMQILKAHSQRRATLREKTYQSLLRRNALQSKYKEHLHAAIYQKRATAEKNRVELLGTDKEKTHARRLQARKVAKSVSQQQETESLKLRESLEDKLQRAKRRRAAYLMEKVSLHNSVGVNWNEKTQKQADHLSRNLLRCWRKFLKQRTTLDLARSYHDLNINASHGKSIPFENFAILIETSSTLRTTKVLLDRLETRYRVLLAVASGTISPGQEDIDHLLTRVTLPNGATPRSPVRTRYVKKAESARAATKAPVKLSRYQVRVVLSAYMILGHPNAVFSGQGVRETALAKSAKKFVQEFELLIDIILDGPSQRSGEESNPASARSCTFRSQLAAFDTAWCSYLNSFVVWKVKDVESLENDLVRAACQMEISIMQKYKPTTEGDDNALTHDVKVFQKQMQVTEHQKLLREKVMHLSGEAGIERMQNALSDTRKKYFQSKEHCSPADSPVAHIPSPCVPTSLPMAGPDERSDSVVQSLSNDTDTMLPLEDLGSSVASNSGLVNDSGEMLGMENVFIVNEFLHGRHYSVADSSNISDENQKVRETMEKAFWDGISDSIQQEKYDHIVVLMKEVRDELYEMSPKSWKPKITEVIDLDILSQLLSSHRLDMEYLGTIMEFALVSLQKLSAVAHENQLKESHKKVVLELSELCQAGDGSNSSHAIALMKGLRFVLEQIQVLKQEISKARMKILEPLLKGPTGLEYLGKAFVKLYGPPSDALNRLPMTMQWLSSVVPGKDQEWIEYKRAILELQEGSSSERPVIPSTALRTGGSFSSSRLQASAGTDNRCTDCKGEKGDLLVRLGLVKLVNNVNGVTQEELPETLKLNFLRLRAVQAQLQKITVIATSILVLRQTLVMEQMISSFEDMESTILRCSSQLSRILDTVVDAGLEQIVQLLSKTAERFDKSDDSAKTQSRRVVMARTLRKSLQAGDPVFVRVSRAVYLATRGVVLAGSGTHGRGLAEKALRQVGAAILTDKVVARGTVLGVMSRVSENVHGPWYARLIQNM
ncbi:uncharacterized protein LOC112501922 isoform X2 [Cynara cardunculus var. scolymus]|uniref:uncharacterized protein LOC112501922 isoform X2 n=1 Tax=Cynara cardunculus var. scolymus TaxID=59895 RepID=UPI000D6236B1|nr:uncharacterized protein LOC112501922 isoform X2 [Cynara cardunculus var. scolymus]